jgi:chromosome segregation ATPase
MNFRGQDNENKF